MIGSLMRGRGLNGFKHLIETTKRKEPKAEIIFTHDKTKRKGHRFYINLEEYRKRTTSRFYSLYRETGLDGASYFLNLNFPDLFEYDRDVISQGQLKKIDSKFPDLLKDLSSKVKNKKVLINRPMVILVVVILVLHQHILML